MLKLEIEVSLSTLNQGLIMAEPNYEIQFKPVSYLNVPGPLVPRSNGNALAAVQRSEINDLEAQFNLEISSRLGANDLASLYAECKLDDAEENVKRMSYTDNVGGIDYTITSFEVNVPGAAWATESFWEVAFFEGNKQISPEHDFLVTAPGTANLIFQSNSVIENGKYRVILQRKPIIPPVSV